MLALSIVVDFLIFGVTQSLNNGVARTPPMGWSTLNLYHREFTQQVFYDAEDIMSSTTMKKVGYEYINVDGGWSVTSTVERNSSDYTLLFQSK